MIFRRTNNQPSEKHQLAFERFALERLEDGAKRHLDRSIFDLDNTQMEYEEIADAHNYLKTKIVKGEGTTRDSEWLTLYRQRGAELAEEITDKADGPEGGEGE